MKSLCLQSNLKIRSKNKYQIFKNFKNNYFLCQKLYFDAIRCC